MMEMLISDLNQCDLDRIELKKLKAEMSIIYIEHAEKTAAAKRLGNDLAKQRLENDSLQSVIMDMNIQHGKALKKEKRKKNMWFVGALLGGLSAVGIHYDWKNSWTEKIR